MRKEVLIWGYLSSFILLLGAIFMNLNLLAGRVLYLVGFFAFNIGYLLPLFYVIFKQNQENKIGVVIVSGILGFFTFLTGVSFFMVSWGGGIVLIYTGGGILILAILLIIALSRRFYETHIDAWFPVLIFGVFIVVSLLTSMVHRHVMRVFSLNNKETVEALNAVQHKNNELYTQLFFLDTLQNEAFNEIKEKSILMRYEAENLNNYIDDLKLGLIKEVEGDKYKMFKGKAFDNLVPVQSNVEINSVKRYMLKKNEGKAYELKQALDQYRNLVMGIIPDEGGWLEEYALINLNTKSYDLRNRRFNKTWEYQHFYGFPLITVLNQLTHIQWKIRVVEGEVLNYYYNQALRLGKGDLHTLMPHQDTLSSHIK